MGKLIFFFFSRRLVSTVTIIIASFIIFRLVSLYGRVPVESTGIVVLVGHSDYLFSACVLFELLPPVVRHFYFLFSLAIFS